MPSVYFNENGEGEKGQAGSQHDSLVTLERLDAETAKRAKAIQDTLSRFFGAPSGETKRYREEHLRESSNLLFNLVTPEVMSALVNSSPEAREFQERLKVAAQKARDTPLQRADGSIARNWTKGYIALAIDSRGNVLGFDSLPEERAKHLNYQILKALRARVLSEHAIDIRKDPSLEENIAILERLGIERKYQYVGAKDDVQLEVGSELRWVYVVGGATIPDSEYVANVYGETAPKDYSYLEGVDPLEAEMDDLFGRLVVHYLLNPNAEVVTILEPHKIAWIRNQRNLLRTSDTPIPQDIAKADYVRRRYPT